MCLNAKIIYLLCSPTALAFPYPRKTMFCIITHLNGALCFFHMFDWLFFIIINEHLHEHEHEHCQGRMLKCVRMRRWINYLIFFPFLTVEATTPLSHEDK